MNKEKLIERLFDREEFEEHKLENDKDSQLGGLQAQNSICYQYINRLLDILEEASHKGIVVDDDKLYNYLRVSEGGIGSTKEAAKEDEQRKQKLLSELLKETIVTQVRKVADYAKYDFVLHFFEFIIVGIIIGILSFALPHKWDLEASKEPIKVQIIEQTIPQSQSEPITPKNFTVVVPMETL